MTEGRNAIKIIRGDAKELVARDFEAERKFDARRIGHGRLRAPRTVRDVFARLSNPIVQLAVPVIAASGGVVFLHEVISLRLVLSSVAILGGIALAIVGQERTRIWSLRLT